MKKQYVFKILAFFMTAFLIVFAPSCKKNSPAATSPAKTVTANPVSLRLYEIDTSVYKQFFVPVFKVGNLTIDNYMLFDTGSGGLVLDADGVLPASMITSTGFKFTGDSVVVNGITITNQTSTITYGADCSTANDTVYGNLAYAPVTIGDGNGNLTVKRLPFFLYYVATNSAGTAYPTHYFDIFGVNNEYDFTFSNGVNITSPFAYYDPGSNLTSGFKIAKLGPPYTYDSSVGANYVSGAVTVGLTAADLSSSSGFVTIPISTYSTFGYVPFVYASITYNTSSFTSQVVFDSGTAGYSYLQDPNFTGSTPALAANSKVNVATAAGFDYSYLVTATDNNTYVENPNTSCSNVSIISIEYFLNNEYLWNFKDHILGLKNN